MDGENVHVAREAMQETTPTTFAYMRAAKRWLIWAPDKQPFYIDGTARKGTLDTPNDLERLGTFDEACRALEANAGRFAGIGFALGADGSGGHWQGIDLDDVPQNHLSDLANTLPGYVERSPSGNGCHAIGYGAPFPALGSNGTGIEAYAGGRYFTFTRDTIRDAALTDLAPVVQGRLAPLHGVQRPTGGAGGTVYADPQTVADLRSALNALSPDDYHQWIKVGRALHELGPVIGRELWLTWSQRSTKHMPEDARKWETFTGSDAPYQTIFKMARDAGWVNPRSGAAQVLPPVLSQSVEQLESALRFDPEKTEPQAPDLVAGLVADEETTLLGGHGGIGKGFLSLQIAVAVALGHRVLNHETPRAQRVLYYSAEDGRKRIGARLRKLIEDLSPEERALVKQNLCLIDASELDPLFGSIGKDKVGPLSTWTDLQLISERFDQQLTIFDGASDTFDGNEIKRREIRPFVKLLPRVNPKRKTAALLIVHIDRASARGHISNDEGYAGNAAWHNSCRRRLYLQRKVERDSETKEEIGETITLRVMKNQDGPEAPDMEVVRQDTGFWTPAVSFGGMVERGGDYAPVILRLIGEYYDRKKWISTSLAANASTGVFPTLKGDPNFPPLSRKQTDAIVRQLEREQKLAPEPYRRDSGGKGERWKVT